MTKSADVSIVTGDRNQIMFAGDGLTAQSMRSIQALRNAEIPSNMIQSHPGKGGKTFKYLSHIHGTRLVIDALDQFFSMDVLDAQILEDGTAFARVQFQVHIPMQQPDGSVTFFTNSITEIGAFDGGGGSMAKAFMLASAASRGFVKCLMRRFGLGMELYKDSDDLNWKQAWDSLWSFVENQIGKPASKEAATARRDKMVSILKAQDIDSSNLLEAFDRAYSIIHDWTRAQKNGGTSDAPSMDGTSGEAKELEQEKSAVNSDGWPGPTWADAGLERGWPALRTGAVKLLGYKDELTVSATIKTLIGEQEMKGAEVWQLLREHAANGKREQHTTPTGGGEG